MNVEEENRRAILAALEPRPDARLLDLGTHGSEFTTHGAVLVCPFRPS